jgi:hypothetical protein
MSAHLGLVLHVQVGNNDLGAEFNNPASQASYTWVAYKDGALDQFCDAAARAWAQAAGNSTYNSVGTQGFPNEPLTELACQTIAALYRWGHDTYGWPYTLSDAPGTPGFGWHGMGDSNGHSGWGGHPNCPGDLRKAQRQHILDLAQGVTPPVPPTQPQPPEGADLSSLVVTTIPNPTPPPEGKEGMVAAAYVLTKAADGSVSLWTTWQPQPGAAWTAWTNAAPNLPGVPV